jgi:hypothetical protein
VAQGRQSGSEGRSFAICQQSSGQTYASPQFADWLHVDQLAHQNDDHRLGDLLTQRRRRD